MNLAEQSFAYEKCVVLYNVIFSSEMYPCWQLEKIRKIRKYKFGKTYMRTQHTLLAYICKAYLTITCLTYLTIAYAILSKFWVKLGLKQNGYLVLNVFKLTIKHWVEGSLRCCLVCGFLHNA